MPETYFRIRWPDGSTQRCYSPSVVVEDYLSCGRAYSVADFVERSRQALTVGSERVRRRYGFGCANAAAQLAEIERRAGTFAADGVGVIVEGFER